MENSSIALWYEQYKTGIFRFALSILGDPAQAEDVLQETFLRLLSGKWSFSPGGQQAWLYRVARNLCYDALRRRKREGELPEQWAGPDGQLEFVELLSPLEQGEREIISLKILGGLTHREIGQVLGITEKAAQKRYERALGVLRKQEENYGK